MTVSATSFAWSDLGAGARSLRTAVLRYVLSILTLLLAWWVVTDLLGAPAGLIPPPQAVFASLIAEWSDYYSTFTANTATKAAIGGAIGISAGLVSGLALGYSRSARWLFEPYLTVFQSFPREALYPIFVIALGVGNLPQITNAALLSYFPMAVTTLHAVTDTRRDYIDLVRSWGASRITEFLHVRLPYALPSLLGALRIAVPFAIIGAVLAEMIGGSINRGLGNLVVSAQAGQDFTGTYAAILILAAMGMSVIATLQAFEYLALRRFRHE